MNPKDVNIHQIVRIFLAVLILAVVTLAGCQGQNILDSFLPANENVQVTISTPQETLPVIASTAEQATPTALTYIDLTIWVPPQFSPYEDHEAARLFNAHLQRFVEENPNVSLDIRVKPASGAAGILDTLLYANQVAPNALPAVVLISRSDLEQAVQNELIQPIEEISKSIDESDWYAFAQSLGIVQGTAYGLPFAADALGLVYRDASLNSNQPSWDNMLSQLNGLIFPAADQNIQFTLALYLSAGGLMQDAQGHPSINADVLAQVFAAYEQGLKKGMLSPALIDLKTDDQAWEAFQTSDSQGLITWASRQLQNPEELKLALLPSLGENPVTLTRGWLWCLIESDEQKKQAAAALVEYLVDADFMAEWTPVSGYLPVRPSSISTWQNSTVQDSISKMLLTAQNRPNTYIISAFNNSIKAAVQEIFSGQVSAAESAQKAAESLEVLE